MQVCSFCQLGLGLIEQAGEKSINMWNIPLRAQVDKYRCFILGLQIRLEKYLIAQCGDNKACIAAVNPMILGLEAQLNPATMCAGMGVCPDQCVAYETWYFFVLFL